MFDWSIENIPKMQADASEFKQGAWSFFSNWGLAAATFIPFIYTYLYLSERSRCFYYIFVMFTIDAFSTMLKLADHQARPYWVSADI